MINFWENQCHLHTVVTENNIGVYVYQFQHGKHSTPPLPTRSLLIESDDYHVRFGDVKIGMKTLVKGFLI